MPVATLTCLGALATLTAWRSAWTAFSRGWPYCQADQGFWICSGHIEITAIFGDIAARRAGSCQCRPRDGSRPSHRRREAWTGIARYHILDARTGLLDDGVELIDRTLAGKPPMLAVNSLATSSERSEQSGFANLVRGTFGMFRNPTAHEARINWPMTKVDAEDLLTLVSMIHRRLDAATMPSRV